MLDIRDIKIGDNLTCSVTEDHWNDLLLQDLSQCRFVIERDGVVASGPVIELLDRPVVAFTIDEIYSIN